MRSHDIHNRQQASEYSSKAFAEKSEQAAIEIYKQALVAVDCIKIKYDDDIRFLIHTHRELGTCHFNLKCFAEAANSYHLSLASHADIRKKDEEDYRIYIQISMAKCYTQLELKNISLAAQFFTDCIPMFAKITVKNAEEKSLGDNILQNPGPFYYYWSKRIADSSYLESDHCHTLSHDAVLSHSQSATQDESAEVIAMFNLLKIQNAAPQVSVVQQPQPSISWAFYQPRHPVQIINIAAPVATANSDSESDNAMDIDDEYRPPTP